MSSFRQAGSSRNVGTRDASIQVINQFPTAPTARQAEQKKTQVTAHRRAMLQMSHVRRLPSNPGTGVDAFAIADADTAAQRVEAYHTVWNALHTQLQA